jgi:hypothetical protein
LPYVEPLSDARTPLADFVNSLLASAGGDDYRFYFQNDGETYVLLSIIPRPK